MPFAVKYRIPLSMEECAPNLGEGISRPSPGERTKLFTVMVTFAGERPMKTTIRAATAAKAKAYASNRWPKSTVLVIK